MRATAWFLGIAATVSALSLCAAPSGGAAGRARDKQVLSDTQIGARIDALMAKMTVEEKAGQLSDLFVFAAYPSMAKAAEDRVAAGQVGALLFVTDPAEINRLQRIAVERTRLKIPLLFGFDVIHGLHTIFPVPIAAAASWDPDGVERTQAIAAREARSSGIHWTFAPMVDIARDARWGRIVESAGEDPFLGSAMAAAQVHGFQGGYVGAPDHVIAGPKHFVGYGAAVGGRDYEEADLSDEALRNVYLPPFKAAIDAGAANIMSAYMPLNGVPMSGNRRLLTDVLRNELGFKGFVVSDAGAVENLRNHGLTRDDADSVARALDAGVDMEMTATSPKSGLLPAAIAAGKLSMAQLDQAVRRVLEVKFRLGLFENPYVDEKLARTVLADGRSLVAARVAAERSAVLLRNEGALPIDVSKTKRLAVIGSLASSGADALGPWVFKQNNPPTSNILDGIVARANRAGVAVRFARGVAVPPRRFASPFGSISVQNPPAGKLLDDDAAIADAVAAAKAADLAVVVVGERQDMAGEMASTSSFDLPGRQQDMLDAIVAAGTPVVVVLMNGRPIDLKDTKAAAILDMWYPGSAGGPATANLLFGDAVPGGKLPFTWPRNAGQEPLYYNQLLSQNQSARPRRYWNEPSSPVYPFGFGLSYSHFAFSNVRADKAAVAPGESLSVFADVTNTGARKADEVAQLYIHQRYGAQARPVRELKGFRRLTLNPGERRTVEFKLTAAELRYWSSAHRDWVQDITTFDYAVGSSSDVKFTGSFEVRPVSAP